jgi:anti-sigma factor RsiW
MDHERARELFSEYMDDELPPETREQVARHLDSCGQCREEYEQFERTFRTFRSLPRVSPPGDLEQKVKRRIRNRSRGRFFAATTQPHVVHRVPYEFISLILILIAMVLMWMMATFYVLEQQPGALPSDGEGPPGVERPAPEQAPPPPAIEDAGGTY